MHLLEAGLACWRLTNMFVTEAGPDDVFARLRQATGIEYDTDGNVVSYPPLNPLHCKLCTSIYMGFAVLLLPRMARRALAISAVAVFVEAALFQPQDTA